MLQTILFDNYRPSYITSAHSYDPRKGRCPVILHRQYKSHNYVTPASNFSFRLSKITSLHSFLGVKALTDSQ